MPNGAPTLLSMLSTSKPEEINGVGKTLAAYYSNDVSHIFNTYDYVESLMLNYLCSKNMKVREITNNNPAPCEEDLKGAQVK